MGVSIFLMTYVVPSILQPLLDQGRPLPLPTRIVKGISDFLVEWGWLLGLCTLILAGLFLAILRTKRGRWLWDAMLLCLPLIGTLLRLTLPPRQQREPEPRAAEARERARS